MKKRGARQQKNGGFSEKNPPYFIDIFFKKRYDCLAVYLVHSFYRHFSEGHKSEEVDK